MTEVVAPSHLGWKYPVAVRQTPISYAFIIPVRNTDRQQVRLWKTFLTKADKKLTEISVVF